MASPLPVQSFYADLMLDPLFPSLVAPCPAGMMTLSPMSPLRESQTDYAVSNPSFRYSSANNRNRLGSRHPEGGIKHEVSSNSTTASKPRQYRKARAYFQPQHMKCLEAFFQKCPYLSTKDRELLAKQLNLSEDRVSANMLFCANTYLHYSQVGVNWFEHLADKSVFHSMRCAPVIVTDERSKWKTEARWWRPVICPCHLHFQALYFSFGFVVLNYAALRLFWLGIALLENATWIDLYTFIAYYATFRGKPSINPVRVSRAECLWNLTQNTCRCYTFSA